MKNKYVIIDTNNGNKYANIEFKVATDKTKDSVIRQLSETYNNDPEPHENSETCLNFINPNYPDFHGITKTIELKSRYTLIKVEPKECEITVVGKSNDSTVIENIMLEYKNHYTFTDITSSDDSFCGETEDGYVHCQIIDAGEDNIMSTEEDNIMSTEEDNIMSQDELINLISETLDIWAQEEVDNNEPGINKYTRLQEIQEDFIEELNSRVNDDLIITSLEKKVIDMQDQINIIKRNR